MNNIELRRRPANKPWPLDVHELSRRASHWLAEGNAASERGAKKTAERYYAKSQRWLDRYNKAAGNR